MFKAKLTFSNGDAVIIKDGQLLFPITLYTDKGETFSTKAAPFELWYHVHDGLIPCLAEMLMKYDFFQIEECSKAFKSSSVVSIENV